MNRSAVDADRRLDAALALGLLRLTLGVNIFLHGAVRLWSGLGAFVSATAAPFAHTPLPDGLVRAFLTALPFLESVLGLLLVAGVFTRWALAAGALLMTALVFGTALRADWAMLGIQMVYAGLYSFLLMFRAHDRFALERLR